MRISVKFPKGEAQRDFTGKSLVGKSWKSAVRITPPRKLCLLVFFLAAEEAIEDAFDGFSTGRGLRLNVFA